MLVGSARFRVGLFLFLPQISTGSASDLRGGALRRAPDCRILFQCAASETSWPTDRKIDRPTDLGSAPHSLLDSDLPRPAVDAGFFVWRLSAAPVAGKIGLLPSIGRIYRPSARPGDPHLSIRGGCPRRVGCRTSNNRQSHWAFSHRTWGCRKPCWRRKSPPWSMEVSFYGSKVVITKMIRGSSPVLWTA